MLTAKFLASAAQSTLVYPWLAACTTGCLHIEVEEKVTSHWTQAVSACENHDLA